MSTDHKVIDVSDHHAPKARIKITLDCDRACEYCINRNQGYRACWRKIDNVTDDTVKWRKYRTIIISGGEPTTDMRLRSIARSLRIFAHDRTMIYLQTNGWGLTKNLVKDLDRDIDGIGLSVHDLDEFRHMLPRWADISRIKPIRLYIQDTHRLEVDTIINLAGLDGVFSWRVWTDGVRDMAEEIFLLKGRQTSPDLHPQGE